MFVSQAGLDIFQYKYEPVGLLSSYAASKIISDWLDSTRLPQLNSNLIDWLDSTQLTRLAWLIHQHQNKNTVEVILLEHPLRQGDVELKNTNTFFSDLDS
jgi:hypothetical protein